MQSGKWILSAYQFSRKWDNENNAIRRNLNAWVRPALQPVHQMKNPSEHLLRGIFSSDGQRGKSARLPGFCS
nr:MAG TPA: hypothetical protein [Caudoviricetes sp.]